MREQYKTCLEQWLYQNDGEFLHEHENNHVQRLIDYLDVVKTPHADAAELTVLQRDFKNFYTQYDQRRGKDFCATFPALADWYNTL